MSVSVSYSFPGSTVGLAIVTLAYSPWLVPSVSLAYTVSPSFKFGIVPLFAIFVQLPSSIAFIWYSIWNVVFVLTVTLAWSPSHVGSPNVIFPLLTVSTICYVPSDCFSNATPDFRHTTGRNPL